MFVAITGSSGLVGKALADALEADGHSVRRLVRRATRDEEREIGWDPVAGTIESAKLSGIDGIVHLAGENLAAHRWNEATKARIRDSRIQSTSLLCRTLAGLASKPSVLVSASAVGYYGDRGDEPVDEASPPGCGFLAELCEQWEAETHPARDADIRVVNLRLGVVLTPEGGALAKMLTPFKLGLGGIIGSGRQYVSWISLDDAVRVIQFALAAAALCGPVNAVAPQPVTNREFTKALGRVLGRPTIFPMPALAARSIFGEMADETLLASARVEPRVLAASEFDFKHPQLEPALRQLLGRVSPA
jgi:uncharacterized protein (TIGR01777 family)